SGITSYADMSYDKEQASLPSEEGRKVKKKPLLVAVLAVTALAAAALGFFWPFGNDREVLQFPATVEIQEVRLGSKVGGRVKDVLVVEGQTVEPGQVLVVFDVPE